MIVTVGGILRGYLLVWLWSEYVFSVENKLESNYSVDVCHSIVAVSAALWGAFESKVEWTHTYIMDEWRS